MVNAIYIDHLHEPHYLQVDIRHINASFTFFVVLYSCTSLLTMLKEKINASQWANLEDSRPGGNSVVSDGGVAASQHNVGLAANWCSSVGCHWDGHAEATSDSSCWGENWASNGNESSVDLRLAVSGGND